MKCTVCHGSGIEYSWASRLEGGLIKRTCVRCVGERTVPSNTIAYVLEAWRASVNRGRRELALAHAVDNIEKSQSARALFVDLDAVLDELRWSARGAVAVPGKGGSAYHFGTRLARAVAARTMSRDVKLWTKQRRAWAWFWDQVHPSVTPLLRGHPALDTLPMFPAESR